MASEDRSENGSPAEPPVDDPGGGAGSRPGEPPGPAGDRAGKEEPRPTPYQMVFGGEAFEGESFPAIRQEAEGHGIATRPREQFELLAEVGRTMRGILPEDTPAEAAEQYRALVYHAFQFWSAGRRVYTLDRALTRYLVEAEMTAADWSLRLPAESIYLRLPPRLFWSSISPDQSPEPIDGAFLTASGDRRLEALLVLGMYRARDGFSVVPLEAPAGGGAGGEWISMSARPEGRDFDTVLPGGEMEGLYSILTGGEALKLIARALWYIDENGDAVAPGKAERETLVRLDTPSAEEEP